MRSISAASASSTRLRMDSRSKPSDPSGSSSEAEADAEAEAGRLLVSRSDVAGDVKVARSASSSLLAAKAPAPTTIAAFTPTPTTSATPRITGTGTARSSSFVTARSAIAGQLCANEAATALSGTAAAVVIARRRDLAGARAVDGRCERARMCARGCAGDAQARVVMLRIGVPNQLVARAETDAGNRSRDNVASWPAVTAHPGGFVIPC